LSSIQGHAPSLEVGLPVPEIKCSVNEDKGKIRDNIRINIKRGLPQIRPYDTQEGKVLNLVGRAVTLANNLDQAHTLQNLRLILNQPYLHLLQDLVGVGE